MRKYAQYKKPAVMGILNVTPDSFSDGGLYYTIDNAIQHAVDMVQEGADIIDIGGESTRPHSKPISLQEELDRVIPVIEKLANEVAVPLSIDTYKPAVMQAAIQAGATLINDVNALQAEGALTVVKKNNIAVCLMHMQGIPQTMQQDPQYQNVIGEVHTFLAERVRICLEAGIAKENILIDPGFGFGKSVAHNVKLLQQLEQLKTINCPILVGLSRKSFLGALLNQPEPQHRLYGSLAATVIAVTKGAAVIRTHDVKPTVEILRLCSVLCAIEQ